MSRTDEFDALHENAAEHGVPWTGRPTVRRELVPAGSGRTVSAIVWGEERPAIVLLHGG